jgi:hypothetical protein
LVDLADNKNLNLELCLSDEIMGDVVVTRMPFWKKVYFKMRNQLQDINPFYTNKK